MAFLRKLESRVRTMLGVPQPWVARTLAGHSVTVRSGSLGGKADYDDAWMYACAGHAKRIYDVGANVGQSALLFLLHANVEEVVLVEANPSALEIAAENLIRNNVSARARFVAGFASDRVDASVSFWTSGTGAAGSMFPEHATTAAKVGVVQQVRTTTLDELSRRYSAVPDLVKLDVEGAEAQALAGSSELAKLHETRFLVEMHSSAALSMEHNAELVLAWASSCGYTAWYLAEHVQLQTPAPIARRGRCHLLLQPSTWEFPPWLTGIPQSAPLPTTA